MPRLAFAAVAFVSLSVLVPPHARAQFSVGQSDTPWYVGFHEVESLKRGPTTLESLSGTNLTGGDDLLAPDGAWVTAIEFGERSDQPCSIRMSWQTVESGEYVTGESYIVSCGSSSTARDLETVHVPSFTTQAYALVGLQICQRSSNDELKGVRVRSGYLETLTESDVEEGKRLLLTFNQDEYGGWNVDEFERANCNSWQPMRMCTGRNKVMVGVRVESDHSSGGKMRIKGLAPICARMKVKTVL